MQLWFREGIIIVTNRIHEITFVHWKLSPFEMKLVQEFKKKGIRISTITFYEVRKKYKQFSHDSIYWLKNDENNLDKFNKCIYFFIFFKKVIKKRYSILIVVTSKESMFPILIFFLLRNKTKKRIYFPFYIAFFKYKIDKAYPWHVCCNEKYTFPKNKVFI